MIDWHSERFKKFAVWVMAALAVLFLVTSFSLSGGIKEILSLIGIGQKQREFEVKVFKEKVDLKEYADFRARWSRMLFFETSGLREYIRNSPAFRNFDPDMLGFHLYISGNSRFWSDYISDLGQESQGTFPYMAHIPFWEECFKGPTPGEGLARALDRYYDNFFTRYKEAERLGIIVTDKRVDDTLKSIFQYTSPTEKTPVFDERAYANYLKNAGMDDAGYRRYVKERMMISDLEMLRCGSPPLFLGDHMISPLEAAKKYVEAGEERKVRYFMASTKCYMADAAKKVAARPLDEKALEKFYAESKLYIQPRQVEGDALYVNVDALIAEMEAKGLVKPEEIKKKIESTKLTDEEVQTYYKEHRDRYRKPPVVRPPSAGTTAPGTTAPAATTPTTPAPAAATPATPAAPAPGTPAPGAPATTAAPAAVPIADTPATAPAATTGAPSTASTSSTTATPAPAPAATAGTPATPAPATATTPGAPPAPSIPATPAPETAPKEPSPEELSLELLFYRSQVEEDMKKERLDAAIRDKCFQTLYEELQKYIDEQNSVNAKAAADSVFRDVSMGNFLAKLGAFLKVSMSDAYKHEPPADFLKTFAARYPKSLTYVPQWGYFNYETAKNAPANLAGADLARIPGSLKEPEKTLYQDAGDYNFETEMFKFSMDAEGNEVKEYNTSSDRRICVGQISGLLTPKDEKNRFVFHLVGEKQEERPDFATLDAAKKAAVTKDYTDDQIKREAYLSLLAEQKSLITRSEMKTPDTDFDAQAKSFSAREKQYLDSQRPPNTPEVEMKDFVKETDYFMQKAAEIKGVPEDMLKDLSKKEAENFLTNFEEQAFKLKADGKNFAVACPLPKPDVPKHDEKSPVSEEKKHEEQLAEVDVSRDFFIVMILADKDPIKPPTLAQFDKDKMIMFAFGRAPDAKMNYMEKTLDDRFRQVESNFYKTPEEELTGGKNKGEEEE